MALGRLLILVVCSCVSAFTPAVRTTNLGAFIPAVRTMNLGNRRVPASVMGWADPSWNWGSANGAAHDEAMKVRGALATPEARKSFLFLVFAGQAPIETVKMALALKCQRARNMGYDSPQRGWEELMEEMAACRFEGSDGEELLCQAIRSRLATPPPEPLAGTAGAGINQFNVLASAAFAELGFEERGL